MMDVEFHEQENASNLRTLFDVCLLGHPCEVAQHRFGDHR